MRNRTAMLITILPLLTGLAFLPGARAISPAPDGCYPNFTTAEGCHALSSLTTGQWNTALGAFTLWKNTDGSFNTAVGTAALLLNIGNQSAGQGIENTAVGAAALLLNTSGAENTAIGTAALRPLYRTAGIQPLEPSAAAERGIDLGRMTKHRRRS